MRRKVKLLLILTVTCLALLWLTACNPFGGGTEAANQQLVKVTRGDITVKVSGSGKIETSREARLTFGSAGKVDSILVKEGDKVKEGQVLARLDTSALELARSQSALALTQTQVTLTQTQLAQKTAEKNLKNTKDTEGTLKLALLNAQISLDQAQKNLDAGITTTDYEAAKAQLNKAQAWYDYVKDMVGKATSNSEDWLLALDSAKEKLDIAQAQYNNELAGYSTQDVAIRKKQVEAAKMAVAGAQKNLDDLAENIAIQELQVTSANQTVAQSRQSIDLARQSLDEAQRQLDEATITAPFEGLVAQVLTKEGEIVPSPSMVPKTIIQLIVPTRMELLVDIDEIDIPRVKLNQEAVIKVDALPDSEFKGLVTAVYPVPKEESGVVLYEVKLSLEVPENSGVIVGMSASADILVEKHTNALLVPSRAVLKDSQGRTIVKVMSGGQVQEKIVVAGIDDGLRTEIVNGLSGDETVLESRGKSTSQVSMFGQ